MRINQVRVCFVLLALAALVGACGYDKDVPASQEDLSVTQMNMACSLGSLPELPDVRITSATPEAVPVPHCKVTGVIGTETNFELLLPDNWNGKFAMGGGAGFVGQVINSALAYGALQSGYATAGTDTGHAGHPVAANWAHNNLERLVSFGHQAVHRTAVNSKALINAYYQKDITNSYFTGCSRGGGQALMEAQRYPADFDGIVAGAPAYNWTNGLAASTTLNVAAASYTNDIGDASFYGVILPDGVPADQQEHAYTSPIWYTP